MTRAIQLYSDHKPPGVHADLPATVETGCGHRPTRIQRMPSRDLLILREDGFHPGLHVRLILDTGREANALVRWDEDDYADVYLLEPCAVIELG